MSTGCLLNPPRTQDVPGPGVSLAALGCADHAQPGPSGQGSVSGVFTAAPKPRSATQV